MVTLRKASLLMFLVSVSTEVAFSLLCVAATGNSLYYLLMIWDGVISLIWLVIFSTDDTAHFDMADDIISTIMLPVGSVIIGAMFKLPILFYHFPNLERSMHTFFGSENVASSLLGFFVVLLFIAPYFLMNISQVKSCSRASLLCKKYQMEGIIYLIDAILFYQSGLLVNKDYPTFGKTILGFSLLTILTSLICVSLGMYLFGQYAFDSDHTLESSQVYNDDGKTVQYDPLDTLLYDSDLGKSSMLFTTVAPWVSDLPLLVMRIILHLEMYDHPGFDDIGGFMLFKNLVFLGRATGRVLNLFKQRQMRKRSSYDSVHS